MDYKENFLWENNHKNIQFRVKRYYETWVNSTGFKDQWQKGMSRIKQIIGDATSEQRSVRAYGGGWSLSKVGITNDYLVDTKQLKALQVNFSAGNLEPGVNTGNYFLAQCGTSVQDINQNLAIVKKALPTSGASDGQTIVGAISTGTHGAAVNVGAMQDNIYGLHIITSPTEHIWVEGAGKIISDAYLQELMPGVKRINDEAVLNAAIVSFGNFGIIHGVLAGCVPLYLLSLYQKRFTWDKVKPCLSGPSNFESLGMPANPFHIEVIVNPFRLDSVIVILMYKVADDGHPTLNTPAGKVSVSPDLLGAVTKFAGSLPHAIPEAMKLMQGFVNNLYPDLTGQTQYPGKIFTSGTGANTSGEGLSTELGVNAADTGKIADIILSVANAVPVAGMISFRFVKKSKATLAFTKFDTSCAIEFPSVMSDQTQNFFNVLWMRLDLERIPYTFHLGQLNNLNATNIRSKWGVDAIDSWMAARKTILPTPAQRTMFSNKFLMDCGLNDATVSV